MFVYSVETAGTKARYRLRIAISAYPTCIRRPALGEFPLEYCYAVWHEKLKWCGYPTVKKIMMIYLFVLTQLTNVTDTHTDRRRMTA